MRYGNKLYYLLVGCLFGISCFLLLYELGDIPNGIHVDEAGSFYDAMSMMFFGVDRYLYHNPVYLINFGGGQSVLYVYLASFFFRIFGISLWSFRLVSVVVSLIAYFCYFKMVGVYKGKKFKILFLFIFTILPFYIMKARWGLDCYLLNPMFIISLYFYILAINRENNLLYLLAGILFGVTFYAYVIGYLIIPLFLVISVIYLIKTKKIKVSNIVFMFVPVVVLGIFLLIRVFVDYGIIENEIVTNFISFPKLWFFRGEEISFLNIKDIVDNFKSIFIYDGLVYNSILGFGPVYWISIPFIVFGFIIMVNRIKNKRADLLDVLMVMLFLVVFLVSMCIKDVNINKVNAIYISFLYFIVVFLEWLSKYRGIFVVVLVGYCFSFISFVGYYFNDYSVEYREKPFFETSSLMEALDYSEAIRKEDYVIYVLVNQGYIYTLLNYNISPYEFMERG